jgi:hypothetical protein
MIELHTPGHSSALHLTFENGEETVKQTKNTANKHIFKDKRSYQSTIQVEFKKVDLEHLVREKKINRINDIKQRRRKPFKHQHSCQS